MTGYYKAACAGFHCKAGSSGGYSKRWKTDADERASGIYRTACNCNLLQGVHPKMHKIQPGRKLSQIQQEYHVDVIMTWIQREMERNKD